MKIIFYNIFAAGKKSTDGNAGASTSGGKKIIFITHVISCIKLSIIFCSFPSLHIIIHFCIFLYNFLGLTKITEKPETKKRNQNAALKKADKGSNPFSSVFASYFIIQYISY